METMTRNFPIVPTYACQEQYSKRKKYFSPDQQLKYLHELWFFVSGMYVCMLRGGFPHALRPRMWSIFVSGNADLDRYYLYLYLYVGGCGI
jgi:hypothetical protein